MKTIKVGDTSNLEPTSNEMLETLFQDRLRYEKLITEAFTHELHTPAVIIRGLAQLLLRNPEQISSSQLRDISRESEQLLKRLETLSSAPTEKISLIQNLSLKEAVEQSILFYEKSCLEKGISIRVDIGEDLRVDSSAARLKSILMALVESSVKAFEFKTARDLKSITIQAQKKINEIHLIISDTGVGLATDQPCLELSLAQKLARDIDIQFSFFSHKDQGNCFTLIFTQ
ncbi:MAG: HAMP domain-containing histidine kinase [Bdellovibrionaceae bacterium]|nr:HAMP domain-containing histidine kinase [Bdellovibrio sp.]